MHFLNELGPKDRPVFSLKGVEVRKMWTKSKKRLLNVVQNKDVIMSMAADRLSFAK